MGNLPCANNCKNLEVVKEYKDYNASLYRYKTAYVRCLDCGRERRATKWIGKITGRESGAWKFVENCSHPQYSVDNIEDAREHTLTGGVLRLFTGPALDGIQYHNFEKGVAECDLCGFHWNVRRDYNEVMENMQTVRKHKPWEKILVKKEKTVTYYE
jgi:hypothetical protein